MKMIKKIYYRIEFQLSSAMAVGSGENINSDKDIIRDSAGNPFIPGSTLAGIYRSLLEEDDRDDYFGKELIKDEKLTGSKVLVYDASLKKPEKKSYRTSIRDCVGLDEWKTVTERKGCKFDFEIIEPGAVFVTYLELNCGPGDRDICAGLAALWWNGRFRIGHKTMRGLGAVKCLSVWRREFLMKGKEDQIAEWLDFDMYDDGCWKEEDKIKWNDGKIREQNTLEMKDEDFILKLTLRQRGGISIRRYAAGGSDEKVKKMPDQEQVVYRRDKENGEKEEVPFIPGTSWAGAFKHHMEKLDPGAAGEYFGLCKKLEGEDGMLKKKSEIWFSESEICNAKSKVLTRNAIDRFTGGVVRNALFTEKMWYGGTAGLEIGFPKSVTDKFKQAMAACIVDLHTGLLSVGGETSIGRGIFEVQDLAVNGAPVTVSREMYRDILEKMRGEHA